MQNANCTRNCWIAGSVIGLLVLIFTSGIGQTSFMGGLFLGIVTAVLMSLLLVWALCGGAVAADGDRYRNRARANQAEPTPTVVAGKPIHLEPRSEPTPLPAATPAPAAAPVPLASVAPTPVRAAEPASAVPKASAPKPAAEGKKTAPKKADAKPDDLKQIKGVGPKLEKLLHENGVTRFAQIAEWDDALIDVFAEKIGSMGGRIRSDDWVAQARILATGAETEFSARVEKGDVY